MKMIICLLVALLPAISHGAALDLFMNQRDATNTNTLTKSIAHPPGTADGVLGYIGSSQVPGFLALGPGLTLSNGVLDAGQSSAPTWASITGKPTFSTVATSGAYADLAGLPALFSGSYSDLTGKPALFSGVYADLTGKPVLFDGAYTSLTAIPATFAPAPHTQAFSTITATPTTLSGYGITDGVTSASLTSSLSGYATTAAMSAGLATKFTTPSGSTAQYVRGDGSLAALPAAGSGTVTSITAGAGLSGGTITGSGTISLPNIGSASTYANVTTDAQGRVASGTVRSQAAAARALNTAFQVSATRDALVNYSVQITVTASIAGGQSGDVLLEMASDSGFTTNVQTLSIAGLGQTYSLAVAIQGVQPQTAAVSGYIPAGYYARLRTVNNTGTPTYALRAGQEVLQ